MKIEICLNVVFFYIQDKESYCEIGSFIKVDPSPPPFPTPPLSLVFTQVGSSDSEEAQSP